MSPSTVKEHMENLCSAGLTVQKDEGHKWKYYELTRKGKNILHPEETKIWIMLAVSVVAMAGIFYDMFSRAARPMMMTAQEMPMLAERSAGAMGDHAMPLAAPVAETVPYLHIAGLVIFAMLLGACMTYIFVIRKKMAMKF